MIHVENISDQGGSLRLLLQDSAGTQSEATVSPEIEEQLLLLLQGRSRDSV